MGVDDIEDVASVLRGNLIEVLPISNSDNASQTGNCALSISLLNCNTHILV